MKVAARLDEELVEVSERERETEKDKLLRPAQNLGWFPFCHHDIPGERIESALCS
jgi:hypothetical protein